MKLLRRTVRVLALGGVGTAIFWALGFGVLAAGEESGSPPSPNEALTCPTQSLQQIFIPEYAEDPQGQPSPEAAVSTYLEQVPVDVPQADFKLDSTISSPDNAEVLSTENSNGEIIAAAIVQAEEQDGYLLESLSACDSATVQDDVG